MKEVRRETEQLAKQQGAPVVLKACESIRRQGGKEFPHVNFHQERSPGLAIVEKLDRILLAAYGLEEEPLLEQMRKIRKGSAHMPHLQSAE